jgi:hypothetical protein
MNHHIPGRAAGHAEGRAGARSSFGGRTDAPERVFEAVGAGFVWDRLPPGRREQIARALGVEGRVEGPPDPRVTPRAMWDACSIEERIAVIAAAASL